MPGILPVEFLIKVAMVETIKELHNEDSIVPLGPLYSSVMEHVSYDEFVTIIQELQDAGVIIVTGELVTYCGK